MTALPPGGLWAAGGLALLAALATLGQGGATPDATLLIHGGLAALLVADRIGIRATAPAAAARGPVLAFAAFALLAFAGALRAPYAFAAWLVLLEVAAFAAAFWLSCRSAGLLAAVLPPVLAVAGALHGVAALGEAAWSAGRPQTTFLNPNHLAAWLVACALVSTGMALSGEGRRRIAGASAAALALGGLVATGSRGGWVALLAGVSALLALRWKLERPRVRVALALAGTVVMLAAGVAVAMRMRDADPYHWERPRIWRASIQAAIDRPWLGTGPGQFAAAAANLNFAQENEPWRFGRSFHNPHSDLVRLPAEFGWPATAAALLAIALGARELRRRGGGSGWSGSDAGAVAALAALGAQALFDDLSTRPALVLVAATLAGVLLARPAPAPPAGSRWGRVAVAGAVGLLVLVGEVAPWMAWRDLVATPRGRLDTLALARLERALDRNPLHPEAWRRLAEHEVGDGTAWDRAGYARAREAIERAIRLQPADAELRRAAAWMEGMACRTLFRDVATRERAAARYREAAGLSRNDATIPFDEARLLLGTGDPEGARRAAERSLRIEPRASAPRVLLAEALLDGEAEGGAERALELLAEAEERGLGGRAPSSPYEARLGTFDRERAEAVRLRARGRSE